MVELDNPSENPCFGCGPANERGLGLRFSREQADDGIAEVVTRFTPGSDEIGWPGFLHGGLHFTLLYEVCYWTALELTDCVHTQGGPVRFEQATAPRVGRELVGRGRLVGEEEGLPVIEARTEGEDGRVLGKLTGPWAPTSRARVEAAGIELPTYLLDELGP